MISKLRTTVCKKKSNGCQFTTGNALTTSMLGLLISTVVFFVASYAIKRYMDDNNYPRGLTRSALIFCIALLISYGTAFVVDFLFPS